MANLWSQTARGATTTVPASLRWRLPTLSRRPQLQHFNNHRQFSNQPAAMVQKPAVGTPKFQPVPFMKENVEQVIDEVPAFKYYICGDEDPKENVFRDIPMDKSILQVRKDLADSEIVQSEMKYSILENGLRIASIDKGGLTAQLGLFVNSGSRFEDPSNFGVSNMIENCAFHSTAHLSWLRTVKTVERFGAQVFCNAGREHICYTAECLREYMPIMVPILTGNVLFPRFLRWELKENARRLMEGRERLEKTPDLLVTELLHTTAWHNNTLGNRLLATEKSLGYYNGDHLRHFMLQYFSPDRMVFVGVNVDHEEMCKWLMRSFVDYNAIPAQKHDVQVPVYTGGDCRHESDNSPLAHLAIAFETERGWNSDDLVCLTVLQSLMGGGGSFSTGGPGKGMYSRLFLNVLNRNDWVDSCMAFNSAYSDSGLFGLYMTAAAHEGANMAKVLCGEVLKMMTVNKDELQRAKNALKSSIWMNLECRQIVIEDVARQLLMSGKVVTGRQFCDLVDTVTEGDIKRVVTKMLSKPPTVVAYGDTSTIPHYDVICAALKK